MASATQLHSNVRRWSPSCAKGNFQKTQISEAAETVYPIAGTSHFGTPRRRGGASTVSMRVQSHQHPHHSAQERIPFTSFRPDQATVIKKNAKLSSTTVSLRRGGSVRATSAPGLIFVCTWRTTVAGGAPLAFSTTTAYSPRTSMIRLNSPLFPSGVSAIVSCSRPRLNKRNSLIASSSTCTLGLPLTTSKRQSTSEGVCRTVNERNRKSPGSS